MRILPTRARPAFPWEGQRAGDDYGAPAKPDWREVDWRDHLHQLEIGGSSLNFVDFGESRNSRTAVICIHGLGGCWQNWLENIPRLAADGRRVIALDLPGFGFSELPSNEISISGYGRTIEALCERLEIGGVDLVGNSMGGFIGAECAIQFPARVERLVLVSAAGISSTELRREPLLAGARAVAALTTRMAARSAQVVTRPRLRRPLYAAIMRHPQRIPTDLLYEVTRGAGRPGFIPALEALSDYDFRDRLADISCPTLIVWGRDDMIVPVKDADEYERLIPGARKVLLDDTGHVSMIERPSTFNDELARFLDETGSELLSAGSVPESSSR
ncbi:MAG: alpha/beta fold hydrolase [Thermoleophilaceae bacterium]